MSDKLRDSRLVLTSLLGSHDDVGMSQRRSKQILGFSLAAPILSFGLACLESFKFYPQMTLGALIYAVVMAAPIGIFLGSEMRPENQGNGLSSKELSITAFFGVLNFAISFWSYYVELHPRGGGAAMTAIPVLFFFVPGECVLAVALKIFAAKWK